MANQANHTADLSEAETNNSLDTKAAYYLKPRTRKVKISRIGEYTTIFALYLFALFVIFEVLRSAHIVDCGTEVEEGMKFVLYILFLGFIGLPIAIVAAYPCICKAADKLCATRNRPIAVQGVVNQLALNMDQENGGLANANLGVVNQANANIGAVNQAANAGAAISISGEQIRYISMSDISNNEQS